VWTLLEEISSSSMHISEKVVSGLFLFLRIFGRLYPGSDVAVPTKSSNELEAGGPRSNGHSDPSSSHYEGEGRTNGHSKLVRWRASDLEHRMGRAE
jgi:hypothetical protein